jgi:hypothetical protein
MPTGVAGNGVAEAGSSGPSSSGGLEIFSRGDAAASCWASLAPPSVLARVARALATGGLEGGACASVAVLGEALVRCAASSGLGD